MKFIVIFNNEKYDLTLDKIDYREIHNGFFHLNCDWRNMEIYQFILYGNKFYQFPQNECGVFYIKYVIFDKLDTSLRIIIIYYFSTEW